MIVKEQISSALTHPRKAFVLSQPGPWLRGNMKAETPRVTRKDRDEAGFLDV